VILAESHTVPLVWLNWVSAAGFECDPPPLAGVAALTPLLLRAGTARRSANQITQEIDNLGATLIAGAEWDAAFLNLELLASDLGAGVDLLIDMIGQAQFPATAVDGLRRSRLLELEHRRRHPRVLADEAFARALYGSSPYGCSPMGCAATLERIEAAEVSAFHRTFYAPANSYLVVVGSFDSAAAVSLLGSFELPSARVPRPALPCVSRSTAGAGAAVTLVDVPHAQQIELRMGHDGVTRDSDDLPALEVLNAILGRGPSSRLAQSLRQRHGLAYHVRSHFAARRGGGPFVVETCVTAEGATIACVEIRREIARLREELVPAADVARAKRSLLGAELQRLQSIRGLGVRLGPAALDGDPADQIDRRRRAIAAVEAEDLREAARRHLDPEQLSTVAAGPAGALRSQFSKEMTNGHQSCPFESSS
jgi:zinc protease